MRKGIFLSSPPRGKRKGGRAKKTKSDFKSLGWVVGGWGGDLPWRVEVQTKQTERKNGARNEEGFLFFPLVYAGIDEFGRN